MLRTLLAIAGCDLTSREPVVYRLGGEEICRIVTDLDDDPLVRETFEVARALLAENDVS